MVGRKEGWMERRKEGGRKVTLKGRKEGNNGRKEGNNGRKEERKEGRKIPHT